MKILCVFGKYQYGNPSRGYGTEYAAFILALKRLGHEVIHFESWDHSAYTDYASLNTSFLETVDKEKPDIILSVQMNYEIWIETWQSISMRGDVTTINWATDDSWRYCPFSRFIAPAFHTATTTYDYVIPKYHRDNIKNVFLTQWATSIDTLQEPLPALKCRYPVSFVGAAHGDRREKVEMLRKQGIEVHCFGFGWENSSVSTEKLFKIINESVISLNFANSKGRKQIKARNFEVPGSGGFLLSEHVRGLESYYKIGQEIITFDDVQDCANKIKYYLNHPEERNTVAYAGYERTRKEHTYDKRLHEIFTFALNAKQDWLKENRKNPPDFIIQAIQKYRSHSLLMGSMRSVIVNICAMIWGKELGQRAARRFAFELSWRLFGAKTYSASGLPGRMFPKI